MRMHRKLRGLTLVALALAALAALAGTASAKLTGEYTKFQFCPYTTAGVARCINSTTEGGQIVLGSKNVTIEKPVVLQGGYTEAAEEGPEIAFAKFVAATNGVTLSKASQNVPGGLLGIVPPEKSPALVKALSKFFFENALTGVSATLELAKPASAIRISEEHLAEGLGTALELPVMVHLENPFLGKSCYVGSSSNPMIWKLTTGATSPKPPTESIKGKFGTSSFLEEARILKLTGNELVDNTWTAPGASGCGGILAFLVNPIVNLSSGLPAAEGKNVAKLKNTVYETSAFAVNKNNKENP
jgi:hypothetical protein